MTRARSLAPAAIATFTLLVAACTSFHAVPIDEAMANLSRGETVRITGLDGQKSLFVVQAMTSDGIKVESGIVLYDQIALLEARHFSLVKSLGFYVDVGALMLVLVGPAHFY